MELWGLPNSSPAAKRHQGFAEKIEGIKQIRIVCSACGRWLPEDGERVADSLLAIHPEVNVIVAHNDEMAIAASRAVRRRGLDIRIMGVDALPGEGGGLQALEQGWIDMSAANSDTHIGAKAINVEENKWRIEEQHLPEFLSCC